MTDKENNRTEADSVEENKPAEPKAEAPTRGNKKGAAAIEELQSMLEEKEREARENYDLYLRSAAELENHKKRTARQMDEFRKYANDSLIMELLTVVDNLERAIASSRSDDHANVKVVEGVAMTLDEILKILDKFGVKPIAALEQPFDPAFHQAVMQEEGGEFPPQTNIKELQKGYLLHDRLLRPAMVVVSK